MADENTDGREAIRLERLNSPAQLQQPQQQQQMAGKENRQPVAAGVVQLNILQQQQQQQQQQQEQVGQQEMASVPLGPPPAYQEIFPVQAQYWNAGQSWLPQLPPTQQPSQTPISSSHPWSSLPSTLTPPPHTDTTGRHHIPYTSSPNVHVIGGQIIRPSRVPKTIRWFFGTVTFMMIFSIVCAFVYVLIVTVNFK